MADSEEMETSEEEEVSADGDHSTAYQKWKSLSPEFTKMRRMQKRAREDSEKMLLEQESVTSKLATLSKQLEQRSKILKKQEDQYQKGSHKRFLENRKNLEKITELQKMNNKLRSSEEDQKREKARLNKRMTQLEENLEEKDEELNSMEEKVEHLEEMSQVLVAKERKSNDELQEARKELINGLKELPTSASSSFIGIKNMGDLDYKPFYTAVKKKYARQEASYKAMELCSLWEHFLKDQSWHPFKIETIEGNSKEVIDEKDEKLRTLKCDYGDEVYIVVKTAVTEMNDYNPSGRYITQELWNYFEGRKATLKEAVSYLLMQWKLNNQGNGFRTRGNESDLPANEAAGEEAGESDSAANVSYMPRKA